MIMHAIFVGAAAARLEPDAGGVLILMLDGVVLLEQRVVVFVAPSLACTAP